MAFSEDIFLLKYLLPHTTNLTSDQASLLRRELFQRFKMGYHVYWTYFPIHAKVVTACEISSFIKHNLGMDCMEQVYLIWEYGNFHATKTTLNNFLTNYENIKHLSREWFVWNPRGFVIHFCDGETVIGAVPQLADPISVVSLTKYTKVVFPSLNHGFFNYFLKSLDIECLDDDQSNRWIAFFANKFPMTSFGNIDWDKIDDKKVINFHDYPSIRSILEGLMGSQLNLLVYLCWRDNGIPLIKTNLNLVIENFKALREVADEIFIFNPTARYVIEVRYPQEITIGVLPGSRESLKRLEV